LRPISGLKKILIIFAVSDILVMLVDLVVVYLFGGQFRSYAGWLFGSNNKETLGSLLFIEGALIVGIGASLAAGYAETSMQPARSPSTPYVTEKISAQRGEFREEQISLGLMLMLVGVPLIIICIIFII
jgi:hypothetical protein